MPPGVVEEYADKMAKVKAYETLATVELFQDDAALLRERDRRVIGSLLGDAAGSIQEGEEMGDRTTILADAITIQRGPDQAPPPAGSPDKKGSALWSMLTAGALTLGGLAGGATIANAVRPEPPAMIDTDTRNTVRFEDPATTAQDRRAAGPGPTPGPAGR